MAIALDDTALIRQSLERHNEAFSNLLKLIPPQYYIVPNSEEVPSKWQKNTKKQKMPKQEVKEATKKAKKAKMDPANQKTTLDILKEEEAAHEAKKAQADVKGKGKGKRKADEMDFDDSDSDSDSNEPADHPAAPAKTDVEPVPMGSGSIVELRAKLHERIAALQAKSGRRRQPGAGDETEPGEETDGMMPSTKDELLEMRRRKRAQMRDRRRKETKERKAKERAEREGKGKGKAVGNAPPPTKLLVPEPPKSRPEQGTAFNVSVQNPKVAPVSKAIKHHAAPSDPKAALAKLEKKKQALEKLDPEARKRREEQDRYEKAQARIEGVKVHDDPARLKKAAKRKEKEKEKSKKDWDKRKRELQISAAAKQKKRTDNILARNERRKEKKAGVKPKKGKARPGFEGKPMPFVKRNKGKAGGKK